MNGWKFPFEKWVLEGWAEHSKQIDGPRIAADFRKNLSDPKAALAAARTMKANAPTVGVVSSRGGTGRSARRPWKAKKPLPAPATPPRQGAA